jgi:hypothetical protein
VPPSPPATSAPTKAELFAAALAALRAELDAVEAMAAMARDEATSEETKSEGKYDTRATEASYLARGQAARIAALRELAAWFGQAPPPPSPTVGLGSLVEVVGPRPGWVLLAPAGRPTVQVQGCPVRVTSPDAPLGQALWAAEEGDRVELIGPQGEADYLVRALR